MAHIDTLTDNQILTAAAAHFNRPAGTRPLSAATKRERAALKAFPTGTLVEFDDWTIASAKAIVTGVVTEHVAGSVRIQLADGSIVRKDVKVVRVVNA